MFLDKSPNRRQMPPGTGGQLGGRCDQLPVGPGGRRGFISVPFATWCNVAIHHAVGTSAALGFPIAVANVASYVVSGLNVRTCPPVRLATSGYRHWR